MYRDANEGAVVGGRAAQIALAATARGRSVQLVSKAGEDAPGDAIVMALAKGGVGHVAMLRDAGRPTPRIAPDRRVMEALAPTLDSPLTAVADGQEARADEVTLDTVDVDLALRYLTEFAVLVLADSADPEMARAAAAAASWADARLIVVVAAGESEPAGLPPDAIAFEAPDADPDGVFAAMVGSFAAALDDGDEPAAAFRATVAAGGWTHSSEDEARLVPEG